MSISELNREDRGAAADAYREERIDLTCAFRWAHRLDMHEATANHFSLSVSDDGSRFLINPDGRHFSRVRASELILVDANDPDTMNRPDAPDPTAWGLHGAIHRNCPHARCVLHLHPTYATVLASLADSTVYPIDQNTARYFNRVAIDDGFEGMAFEEEGERCSRLLSDKPIMMMGNHGVLAAAPTVAQSFDNIYYFERAARNLVIAYSTRRELRMLPDETAEKTARQWENFPNFANKHFRELKAILDEEEPDYRD